MNRRSFLTNATRLAATGAALAIAANAPHLLAQPQPTTAAPAAAPAAAPVKQAKQQPTRNNKRLGMYASHRSIRSASLWALMIWWAQYGAGVQACYYRGVPRAYVREQLFLRWEIVAEEHIFG